MELNWIVYLNRTHSIQAFSLISWSGIRELGFVLFLVTVNLQHNNLFLIFFGFLTSPVFLRAVNHVDVASDNYKSQKARRSMLYKTPQLMLSRRVVSN